MASSNPLRRPKIIRSLRRGQSRGVRSNRKIWKKESRFNRFTSQFISHSLFIISQRLFNNLFNNQFAAMVVSNLASLSNKDRLCNNLCYLIVLAFSCQTASRGLKFKHINNLSSNSNSWVINLWCNNNRLRPCNNLNSRCSLCNSSFDSSQNTLFEDRDILDWIKKHF